MLDATELEEKNCLVMGTAEEARALLQRMSSSRCFAQEDSRKPSKLASCQNQSSIASTKHIDPELLQDQSNYLNLPANTKWWIKRLESQMQLDSWEKEEMEILKSGFMSSLLEDVKCKRMQQFVDLPGEYGGFMETGISEKLNEEYFRLEETSKKAEPWWRTTTDSDELAFMVATKSLDYFENCDLPSPQRVHTRINHPNGDPQRSGLVSGSLFHETGFLDSLRTPWEQEVTAFERSFRFSSTESKGSSIERESKSSESDLKKGEILEALRHSQTRAREAEEAAKEAYTEKEHIIKLLFKQAAQLFAYKQWFQLLQLEGLYLQMQKKNEETQKSKLLAEELSCGGRNQKKRSQKEKGQKGEIGRRMVAFAVGFSLVGAGLLLGWNIGWLLPF